MIDDAIRSQPVTVGLVESTIGYIQTLNYTRLVGSLTNLSPTAIMQAVFEASHDGVYYERLADTQLEEVPPGKTKLFSIRLTGQRHMRLVAISTEAGAPGVLSVTKEQIWP